MKAANELEMCQGDSKCSSCATCWRRILWLADTDYDDEPMIGFMPDKLGGCVNYAQREYYGG